MPSGMKPKEVDNRGRTRLLFNTDLNFPPRHTVWKAKDICECEKCGQLYTKMNQFKHVCKNG